MVQLSPEMTLLREWMIISVFLYVVGGLSFLFGQNILLGSLNKVSSLIFRDRLPLIPLSGEKFWLTLTNSMMIMLIVICAFVIIDPCEYYPMIIILLFSKAASTLQYLYFFFKEKKYFAYLVGAMTDGPIFLVTLYLFIDAAGSFTC